MTNIYIHIGLQKTGTTALQELIFKNLDANYFRYINKEIFNNLFKDNKPVIWSNEDLSGVPHLIFDEKRRDSRFLIAKNLKVLFPKAKIIVGIRNPEKWIDSIYRESVRQGLALNFDEFYRRFDKKNLDFDAYIKLLRELFPKVFVYKFEDLKNDFDKAVKDICDFMEVCVPKYKNRILNRSLTDSQVKAFRSINRFFSKPGYNPDGKLPTWSRDIFWKFYNIIRKEDLYEK